MKDINDLYKKWTDGEDDNPFSKESEWRGDMVKGFVIFCLKENLTKHNNDFIKECKKVKCKHYNIEYDGNCSLDTNFACPFGHSFIKS